MDDTRWSRSTRWVLSGHWDTLDDGFDAAVEELKKGNHAPEDGCLPVEANIRKSASGRSFTATIYYERPHTDKTSPPKP